MSNMNESVGKITQPWGMEEPAPTPPWGLLGLGYSMRGCNYTIDTIDNLYLIHRPQPHALGKLAERLVEKGMLADAGEDDHPSDGGAGQQHYPVEAESE